MYTVKIYLLIYRFIKMYTVKIYLLIYRHKLELDNFHFQLSSIQLIQNVCNPMF